MRTRPRIQSSRSRRGAAIVAISAMVAVLAILSMAVLAKSTSQTMAQRGSRHRLAARYIAEAALADAVFDIQNGGTGVVGSPTAPERLGGARFWVEAQDQGGGVFALTATGIDGFTGSTLELVVGETSNAFFNWAAFGDESMTLDSNARVDSYSSGDGPYEDQDVNGNGNSRWASDEGNIGSNGDVELFQNSSVHGDATSGPSGTTTVNGNAEVSGSTAPAPETVAMPEIEIPELVSTGPLVVAGGDTLNLPAGSHRFDDLDLGISSTLHVTGPAVVVLSSAVLRSQARILVDGTAGAVEFIVEGDFVMNSNTLVAPESRLPAELSLKLAGDNIVEPGMEVDLDQIDFDSNAMLYGTIYAPHAEIYINSNFELFGSVISRRLTLDSNARVHFDEALLQGGGGGTNTLESLCWRELTYSIDHGTYY